METFLLNLLDGVGQINFQLVGRILLIVFVIFWIVVLDWVWLDAGERTGNKTARIIYLLLVLFLNVFGWIIYLIIRPSQTIEQIYWGDLERRYLKYETAELGDCPKCGTQLYPGYVYCPKCGLELKVKCSGCDLYIDKSSEYCPFCGEKANKETVQKEMLPTREVMEQQIQASKEEATKVVESEQTRYSTKKQGLTVKLGSAIIGGYQIIIDKAREKLAPKPSEKVKPVIAAKQKKGKKKKNKKH